MRMKLKKLDLALAAIAALGTTAFAITAENAVAQTPTAGKYVAGDVHNHSTCSDGSISMQKKVKKVTGTGTNQWGLDWFVQAGHGGNGNRNCTLVEDASLATPAYPFTNQGPTTTWATSIGVGNIKGLNSSSGNMWRWQSLQEFQYPMMEYLSAQWDKPLFLGLESVVAGHEHASMSVITGQMPLGYETHPGNTNTVNASRNGMAGSAVMALAKGNANALAQWEYCFDRNDTDTSRGVTNNWSCDVPAFTGGDNSAIPASSATTIAVPAATTGSTTTGFWNSTAQKLIQGANRVGGGNGTAGHIKTMSALKWMVANDGANGNNSYYVPAHLERAGPFTADGSQGYNVEHLRNFNNVAPNVAFGFETQPGHGASANRGEYQVLRNGFPDGSVIDSVGGTTYGGTGVYGAQVGGVWDSLLGEGRNFWFFASSDWHNRGIFSVDDRRTTQDFMPGEYQRNYTLVRNGADKLRPNTIVDGLRSGNNWAASGQLIDRLAFVACSGAGLTTAIVESAAVAAATAGTAVDGVAGCANMGEKLVVAAGSDIIVSIVVRDPSGVNNSPYTFSNPSLLQVGITQPTNQPVLDHFDVITGQVTGYRVPGAANYAGAWPSNTNWLSTTGVTAGLGAVPAAAKNTTATVSQVVNSGNWSVNGDLRVFTYVIPAVQASQYVRVRGTNMPAGVPSETDINGNPLSDLFTNANDLTKLSIPCTTAGTGVPANGTRQPVAGTISGCPNHLPVVAGVKMVAYDVAAWADLWFYSNPIYIQVNGSFPVAGVGAGGTVTAAGPNARKSLLARAGGKATAKYVVADLKK